MIILSPLGKIYRLATGLRNQLYDRGVLKSASLGARTISVGNITAGGTGKTPFVGLVAQILFEAGEQVCIISRGYGRKNQKMQVLVSDGHQILADAENAGDEPLELARKLIGKAAVVSDANRIAAAKWAVENLDSTAFVLDDGFQHRRAKRDLDILLVDATNPFGNGHMLPCGILRESISGVERADAIVITRSELAENCAEVESKIRIHNSHAPIFRSTTNIARIVELSSFRSNSTEIVSLVSGRAFGFCGLGNSGSFYAMIRREFSATSVTLVGEQSFDDHHFYTLQDIESLNRAAKKSSADFFLTTAKDAVKLENLKLSIPCYVIEIEPKIDEAEKFRELIISFSS